VYLGPADVAYMYSGVSGFNIPVACRPKEYENEYGNVV
jgi:hypothetical protein